MAGREQIELPPWPEIIAAAAQHKTFASLARALGMSAPTLRHRAQRDDVLGEIKAALDRQQVSIVERALAEPEEPDEHEPSPEEQALAQKVMRLQSRLGEARTEVRQAKRAADEAEQEAEQVRRVLAMLDEAENVPRPEWLGPREDDGAHRATLVAPFSDFHIGEVVEPGEMAGYNAYNPEIAEKRVRRWCERVILLARTYLQGVNYDGVVVPNLGDTISGDIHEELAETNGWSNYEAIPYVVSWLEEAIGTIADEFGRVHVPCVPGNHPRDRRKPRYKKRSAHNADTLISKMLRQHFRNDDRVTFDIPDGISADFKVYDVAFRIEHGDEAKGGSGIQGAMLPIALRTHRLRKQAQAEGAPFDVLLIGHWHQLMSMPAKGFICNGAGKGYDEYSRGKGFEPEPPQQALLVVTPEHGIGVQAPVFVAKREDEGW